MSEKSLNHFTYFSFSESFWAQKDQARGEFFLEWADELQSTADRAYFYQIGPMRADIDGMVWCALPAESPAETGDFFDRLAKSIHKRRAWIKPVQTLWGYTRPSDYSRAPSPQEIDPFSNERKSYLVAYPFVKTIEWYLLGRDTRQGMMNEHIRTGHQYPEIKQLLLYSFGLQDQEFVVVYETEDLFQFSKLVNELRGSEVRRYTERDTPVYTAVHHSPQEMANLYGRVD